MPVASTAGGDRSGPLMVAAAVVGLVLRVAWVLYAHRPPLGLYDPARYAGYADLIADGSGYVQFTSGEATAYYPPGYPGFLAALEWLGRHTFLTDDLTLLGGLVQALLGAGTVLLTGLLARRLLGPAAGVVAAGVSALYPNLVFHTAALLSETLFNALFVGSLLLLVWKPWSAGISARRLVGSAVLLGAAVMVRPISVAVIPAMALAWWLHDHDWRLVLRRTACFVGIAAAFIVPWTVRNLVRMDEVVLLSTNTGDNLCIGHRPESTGGFTFHPDCDTGESTANSAAAEVRHDRELTRRSIRWIAEDPSAEIPLTWRRVTVMFRNDHDGLDAVQSYGDDPFIGRDAFELGRRVADTVYVVVMAIAAVGMVLMSGRRRPERLLLVLSTVAILAVPLFFFGDPRFKAPAIPLAAVAFAAAVTRAGDLLRRRT